MNTKYNEFGKKLMKLQHLLHQQHFQKFENPDQKKDRIIALLKMQPESSIKELSYLLGLPTHGLIELLKELKKGGYVKLTSNDTDPYSMTVQLTDSGRAYESAAHDTSADALNCLTSEEQSALNDYLNRITASLEAEFGTASEKYDKSHRGHIPHAHMHDKMFKQMMPHRHCRGERGEYHDNFYNCNY